MLPTSERKSGTRAYTSLTSGKPWGLLIAFLSGLAVALIGGGGGGGGGGVIAPPRADRPLTVRAHVRHGFSASPGSSPPNGELQPEGGRAPIKLFIDAGVNNGDSMASFLTAPSLWKALKGGGAATFLGSEGLAGRGASGDWEVWAFEANPRWTDQLNALRSTLLADGRAAAITLFTSTALSVSDGNLTFYHDNMAGSSHEGGATVVAEAGTADKSRAETVASRDLVGLLLERGITEDDTVVLKVWGWV